MALRSRTDSSGAGPSARRESLRGEKRERERESGADLPLSGSKRSRTAEAGASKEGNSRAQSQDDGTADAGTHQAQDENDLCPITDKNERPFRLMDMPPEVRIEIYRACLTRPFEILLSKEPKPIDREKERGESIVVGNEGFVDGTMSQESEEEEAQLDAEAIQTLAAPPTNTNTNDDTAGGSEPWPARGMRALRSLTRSNMQRNASNSTNAANNQAAPTFTIPHIPLRRNRIVTNAHTNNPPRGRRSFPSSDVIAPPPRAPRPQDVDPLLVNLLRASKLIYKESRAILYGENTFLLDLDTAQPTLANLHQRSRGQIKHLRVTIPTHNEILERFAEVVRLQLRYCWRLQRFVIHTPFVLPGAEGSSTSGNTTVYANAFDILRWLPRKCEVMLEGNVCEEIRKVVEKNLDLAKNLDDVSHSRYVDRLPGDFRG
ncbi:hypothetical protein MBLNU13_g08877t1 [Cladosporium sp. NU13]